MKNYFLEYFSFKHFFLLVIFDIRDFDRLSISVFRVFQTSKTYLA